MGSFCCFCPSATDFERVRSRDSCIILLLSLSASLLPKESKEGVERRLDNGLDSLLGGEVTVMGALFLTGVNAGGGLSSDNDTPSTAAVTLTVSLGIRNPSPALPS